VSPQHASRRAVTLAVLALLAFLAGRRVEPGPCPFEEDVAGSTETHGLLRIEHPGRYHFGVKAKGRAALLRVDGVEVRAGDDAPPPVELGPGLVPIELRHDGAGAVAYWSKEIPHLRPIPPAVIYAPDVTRWRFGAARVVRVAGGVLALVALLELAAGFAGRRRPVLFGLAAVALSILAAAGVAETTLRVAGFGPIEYIPAGREYPLHEPHAEFRYSGFLPYLREEFETSVRYNALGYRDLDRDEEKPAGVRRIVVLGDSYVEALEVELEDTFPRRLERLLNETAGGRWEVLAFGRGATGPVDQLEVWDRVARGFHPDVVVLAFFAGNDVLETSPELSAEFWRWIDGVYFDRIVRAKIDWLDRWRWARASRLGQLVADRTMRFALRGLESDLGPANDVFRDPDPRWRFAWQRTGAAVGALADRVADAGARFVVLEVDPVHALGSAADRAEELDLDLELPNRELRRICDGKGLELVELAPAFRALREKGVRYSWADDGHWNAEGHRVAAAALFERLRQPAAAMIPGEDD